MKYFEMYILGTALPVLLCCAGVHAQKAVHISNCCAVDGWAINEESYTAAFDPSSEAIEMVRHIVEAAGVPSNFDLRFIEAGDLMATVSNGQRYLLYSNAFLAGKDDGATYWGAYFQLAHAIGHHLKKHDFEETGPWRLKYNELDADVFAGAALRMLGATLQEARNGVAYTLFLVKTDTRPSERSRLEAMALGWERQDAKLGGEQFGHPVKDACPPVPDFGSVEPHKDKAGRPELYSVTKYQSDKTNQPDDTDIPIRKNNGSSGNTGSIGGSGMTNPPVVYSVSSKYENMPNFPWPPPNCYQHRTLVENLGTRARALKDIDSRLQRALDANGYFQRFYYQVPGGFALVTQLEQFEEDGSIHRQYRWKDYPVRDDFTDVWAYVKSLVMPTPGRFRVFVFVVTDQPYPRSKRSNPSLAPENLTDGGFPSIPLAYSKNEVTSAHRLELLIYEFEAPHSTKKCIENCSPFLDVQTHIKMSGLSGISGF